MTRRFRVLCAAAIIAGGLAFSGCATTGSSLDAQTSEEWQSRVLTIAESADAGDVATALSDLDALETEATEARAEGEISAERAAVIQQAIAVVRSDLEAAAAPTQTPVPSETVVTEPTTTDTDSESDSGDDGNSGKKDEKAKKNDGKKKDDNGKGKGNDD